MTSNQKKNLSQWENTGTTQLDEDMLVLRELERRLSPLTEQITSIRALIASWRLCHFKSARRLARLIYIIGALDIETDLSGMERTLPFANNANPPQRNQLIGDQIGALQGWLDNRNLLHYMPEARPVAQEVYRLLGKRSPVKDAQVEWLITVLPWGAERDFPSGEFSAETGRIYEQISATRACSYFYFEQFPKLMRAIGDGLPIGFFPACGGFDQDLLDIAKNYYLALWQWIHSGKEVANIKKEFRRVKDLLGERSEPKLWLTASLAKTIWGQVTPFVGSKNSPTIEKMYKMLDIKPFSLPPLSLKGLV
jgi:hypothetical protein